MEGLRAGGYLGRESQSGNDDGQSVTGSPFSVFLRGGVRGLLLCDCGLQKRLGFAGRAFLQLRRKAGSRTVEL